MRSIDDYDDLYPLCGGDHRVEAYLMHGCSHHVSSYITWRLSTRTYGRGEGAISRFFDIVGVAIPAMQNEYHVPAVRFGWIPSWDECSTAVTSYDKSIHG